MTLNVSSSPHVREKITTKNIMYDVVIALVPATVFGCIYFGLHALLVVLATVATAVFTEWAYQKAMKLPLTVSDGSALVTGLLIALNMPPEIPIWMPMLGSVFAIIIVKQLFGGLGQNFMNPALAARCFLLISFSAAMTGFTVDGVTCATPLAQIKAGESFQVLRMFVGMTGGTIGETSTLCLLVGALYLFLKDVISPRIPFIYIGTFVVFMILFSGHGFDVRYLAAQVCGGGLMLGAFFMATDYVTSPITKRGQILFALFLGIMTGIIRVFSQSAEGVSYAIILGNLLVPLIEKITMPIPFGKGARKHGK